MAERSGSRQGFAAGAIGGAIGAAIQWGAEEAYKPGHMSVDVDQKEPTEAERVKMFEDAQRELKASGKWPANAVVKYESEYVNQAEDGETRNGVDMHDANNLDRAGFSNLGGLTTKSFFFKTTIQIFKAAFLSGDSPFGEHLSGMQALKYAIEHEFGHAYGGCGGGPVGEACADNYAKAQLGY